MILQEYKLPGDKREMEVRSAVLFFLRGRTDIISVQRLSLQHRMWRLLVGGLYPSSLDTKVAQLLTADGSSRAVLDVGCGSGIWLIFS
jgi:hypothetical protein